MDQQRELNSTELLDLQDEVLLHVVSKLDHHSKKALRATISRLCHLVSNNIHTLRFRKVYMKGLITVPMAQRLLRVFPVVTRMEIDFTYVRSKAFILMASRWPINALRIGHFTRSTEPADYDYECLAVAFPNLKSLDFQVEGWKWTPPSLGALAYLTSLTSLVMPNNLATNPSLAPLSAFRLLHTFSAENDKAFESIVALTQLSHLRALHLTIGNDGDKQLTTLASLSGLTSLHLSLVAESEDFNIASVAALSALGGLQALVMRDAESHTGKDQPTTLPEAVVRALALGLTSLCHLELVHIHPECVNGLPVDGFSTLHTMCLHVKRLRPVETAGLHNLLPLPGLQRLELYDTAMDADNTLLRLVALQTSLKCMVLPLSSQVQMVGLGALSALCELRMLVLYCQQDGVTELTAQLVQHYVQQSVPACSVHLVRCPNLNRAVVRSLKAGLDRHVPAAGTHPVGP